MDEIIDHKRRIFLTSSAALGTGLLLGIHLSGCEEQKTNTERTATKTTDTGAPDLRAANPVASFAPNAWLQIGSDDRITVQVGSSEMGQGVMTAIPMLLAEELDADWSTISTQFAPNDAAYTNSLIGQQLTGGSTTIRAFWTPLREAGATAREMLIGAAAQRWQVKAQDCHAEDGVVIHKASGRRARFGELAEDAAKQPVPQQVFLKEAQDFRLLGTAQKRLDTPAKVNGSAVFGQDVHREGMLIASVLRCPVFGGTLKSFDASRAKAVPGLRKIFAIEGGVAIAGEDFWSVKRARDLVDVVWDEGPNANMSSASLHQQLQDALTQGGADAFKQGDVTQAIQNAATVLDAQYEVPYLAHACMEPMNCTAEIHKDRCDIWVPTQAQTRTQKTAENITGLPAKSIHVHTTYLGGGFGRRSEQDFVADALHCAKALGVPVKLMWTREDDTAHDYYRPATLNLLRAALDKDGQITAWSHRIAGQSIFSRVFPGAIKNGIDNTSVEGAANLPYAIPNRHITYALVQAPVPVGFWRSVGSSQNAYVTECFFDELAKAAGKDPYALRMQWLADHPRHRTVLKQAADAAGWGQTLPAGQFQGMAVAEAFGSICAQVAQISINADKQIRVHKVVCAIDCGMIVNPNTVEAQMQSGIVYGLTAALKGQITLSKGRVEQSNFHDYPMLRMDEMPAIEVHIIKSAESPGGVGEPGTPPIAPALANAVFAATGKPVRSLPIRL